MDGAIMNDILLCTIGDDRFLPGCEVLLYSMQRNVPDFHKYPLKIYFDEKISSFTRASRERLRRIVPHVEFEAIDCEVYRKVKIKVESHRPSYLTLEVFRETKYRQVLFFDTDMLCLRDFTDMFALPDDYDFVACEAGRAMGAGRWAEKEGPAEGRWARRKWFGLFGRRNAKINAGFFVVGRRFRNRKVYEDLLHVVSRRRNALSLDQWVINSYFGSRNTMHYFLPNEYNWRALDQFDETANTRVKLLHYTGFTHRAKPWEAATPQHLLAYRVWNQYAEELRRRAA
jgi:lipopolysaccharide biosynthesis glycosyltransferase